MTVIRSGGHDLAHHGLCRLPYSDLFLKIGCFGCGFYSASVRSVGHGQADPEEGFDEGFQS